MLLIDSRKMITNVGGSQVKGIASLRKMDENGIPEEQLSEHSLSQISAFRHMDAPFQLLLETFREAGEGTSFVLTQVSPDQTLYISSDLPKTVMDINRYHALHRHDFYELLYVVDGDVYQIIENSRHFYPAGSCCLLNPNVYHTEERERSQRLIFLDMQKEFLVKLVSDAFYFDEEQGEDFQKLRAFVRGDQLSNYTIKEYMDFIPREGMADTHVHACFEQLFKLMQEPGPGASFQIRSIILSLLCRLFHEDYYRPAPIRFTSSKEEQLFRDITRHIEKNHNRTGRRELEEEFHYSGDYLYKLVRKFTGLSLSDYTISICLRDAAQLLATTDIPVSDIIDGLGFTNQTHFYKLFRKRYNASPAVYRKNEKAGG